MNIKSASGFPTPNTVCVREQARCPHFVQALTRSRTAASKSALFGACSRRPMGDVHASQREAATGAACNRARVALDARGPRSFPSRILSSAAMTRSRAGCVMCSDHPKFRARLQTISVKDTRACNFWHTKSRLNSKFSGPKPPPHHFRRRTRLLKIRGGFANRPLDPATPVQRRAPF
jgi:hypothetical protein